jgi:ketosteroid isomerase-like protein
MTRSVRLASYLVSAIALVYPTPISAQTRGAISDQEALIQLEREWNDAFYRRDLQFLDRVLADEFVATYEDGSRGNKARELELTEAFNQQVDSSVQDEFSVKVYGDAAVVWFTLHLVGPRQGQPVEITFRYVDVFVWRDLRWQCVSSQSTKVPESKGAPQ